MDGFRQSNQKDIAVSPELNEVQSKFMATQTDKE